jgi:hypothetical protein
MRRREFIAFVGSSAAALPLAVRAQQPALPIVAFIHPGSARRGRSASRCRRGLLSIADEVIE